MNLNIPKILEDIKFKELATEWVDNFWDEAQKPFTKETYEMKNSLITNSTHLRDDVRVGEISKCKTNIAFFIWTRLRLLELNITPAGLVFLSNIIDSHAGVSMYCAAIAHTFYPNDVDDTKLITFEWLSNVFDNRYHDSESLKKMWDQQRYLGPDQTNLTDRLHYFMMMTPMECGVWAASVTDDSELFKEF